MASKVEQLKALKAKKPAGKLGDKEAEDQLDEEAPEGSAHEASESPEFEAGEDEGAKEGADDQTMAGEEDAHMGASSEKTPIGDATDEDLFKEMQLRGLSMADYQDFCNAPGKADKSF